jgi:hypothetical protein
MLSNRGRSRPVVQALGQNRGQCSLALQFLQASPTSSIRFKPSGTQYLHGLLPGRPAPIKKLLKFTTMLGDQRELITPPRPPCPGKAIKFLPCFRSFLPAPQESLPP